MKRTMFSSQITDTTNKSRLPLTIENPHSTELLFTTNAPLRIKSLTKTQIEEKEVERNVSCVEKRAVGLQRSTKHSKQERDRSIKLLRDRYVKLECQYLIPCEGTEGNYKDDECDYDIDSMNDAMHTFIFNAEPLKTPESPENSENSDNNNTICFLTSLGLIPHKKASDIAKGLCWPEKGSQ